MIKHNKTFIEKRINFFLKNKMGERITFTLKKRAVGSTFYWYINLDVQKALDLKNYDELDVELINKKLNQKK